MLPAEEPRQLLWRNTGMNGMREIHTVRRSYTGIPFEPVSRPALCMVFDGLMHLQYSTVHCVRGCIVCALKAKDALFHTLLVSIPEENNFKCRSHLCNAATAETF